MKPRKLIIRNFLSHDYSVINFDNFNSLLILGSYNDSTDESNGSGKSSILEAIRWVLFDKSRRKKKDKIVKRDATSCSVEFKFEINNQLYRIIRKRDKVIGESDVNLSFWNGSEFETIDCDTNTATDIKITNIINFNHDVFINSVYFKQGDISLFTESTVGKRKDILKSLLKLDKWDAYQKKTKDYLKTISVKIEQKQKDILNINKLEQGIKEQTLIIDNIKKGIKNYNDKFDILNKDLIEKKSRYQFITNEKTSQELKKLQKEFSNSKKRISDINKLISGNNNIIEKNTDILAKYKQRLKITKDEIRKGENIDLGVLQSKLWTGKTKEKLIKGQITVLQKDIKLDKECNMCLRPISSLKEAKSISEKRKIQLDILQNKYFNIFNKLKKAELRFREKEKYFNKSVNAGIEYDKIKNKLIFLKNNIDHSILQNKTLEEEFNFIKSKNFIKRINELKHRLNKDNVDKLTQDILNIESGLQNSKIKYDELNIKYGKLTNHRNNLIKEKKKQLILHKELVKLNENFLIYDKLRHCFGKDGIQSIIIENVIDELENYTNEILYKICNEPTSISIEMQRQTDNGSWAETFDINVNIGGILDELEALSGGESFRISLALRLALSKILAKRMGGVINFLLLDEISSSLDTKGLNTFADIIKELSSDMKILIITHDDRLKDKFDNIMIVEKGIEGSRANI